LENLKQSLTGSFDVAIKNNTKEKKMDINDSFFRMLFENSKNKELLFDIMVEKKADHLTKKYFPLRQTNKRKISQVFKNAKYKSKKTRKIVNLKRRDRYILSTGKKAIVAVKDCKSGFIGFDLNGSILIPETCIISDHDFLYETSFDIYFWNQKWKQDYGNSVQSSFQHIIVSHSNIPEIPIALSGSIVSKLDYSFSYPNIYWHENQTIYEYNIVSRKKSMQRKLDFEFYSYYKGPNTFWAVDSDNTIIELNNNGGQISKIQNEYLKSFTTNRIIYMDENHIYLLCCKNSMIHRPTFILVKYQYKEGKIREVLCLKSPFISYIIHCQTWCVFDVTTGDLTLYDTKFNKKSVFTICDGMVGQNNVLKLYTQKTPIIFNCHVLNNYIGFTSNNKLYIVEL
jgi:hypothetical protein